LHRRVYLDYRTDPAGLEDGFHGLSGEAAGYLSASRAAVKTPVERLIRMNGPAYELYRGNGIDLRAEPLEVSVCAQHHNGGLAVDVNWQTSVRGLYAAGECAGTFGAYRPGGAALNSTQVGSLRAAEHIAYNAKPGQPADALMECAGRSAEIWIKRLGGLLLKRDAGRDYAVFSHEMSSFASYVRDVDKMKGLAGSIKAALSGFFNEAAADSVGMLPDLIKSLDTMVTQLAILSAMVKSAETEGPHGSALVLGGTGTPLPSGLSVKAAASRNPRSENSVLVTKKTEDNDIELQSEYKPVRPLPRPDGWFENVWRDYRERTGAGI